MMCMAGGFGGLSDTEFGKNTTQQLNNQAIAQTGKPMFPTNDNAAMPQAGAAPASAMPQVGVMQRRQNPTQDMPGASSAQSGPTTALKKLMGA